MPNWGLDDDFAPEASADASRSTDREDVPEGDHAFTIKRVIDHGEKIEFRLEHGDRRYGWVFARVPLEANWGRRILSSLRRSLGMGRDEWAAAPITDLVGRRVHARIYHKAGRTGGVFVNVGEFLPVEHAVETATSAPAVERAVAPPTSRPPARRTPTQKADAVSAMPDDDIPF